MICKRLYKSGNKCGFFYYLFNKHKIFHLFGLCLQNSWKFMCNTSDSDRFHGQGRYGIKRYFQHLLAGKTC